MFIKKYVLFNITLSFLLSAISSQAQQHLPSSLSQPAKKVALVVQNEEQALTNKYFLMAHMEMASNKIEQFLKKIILKKELNDQFTEECLKTCREAYQDAMKAMQKGNVDVSMNNYYKADVDVNAFSIDIRTCEECLNMQIIRRGDNKKDDVEVKKFQEWAKGIANYCHSKLQKFIISCKFNCMYQFL